MTYKVIGLMSGSSLDGVDIVYCHYFFADNKWYFELKNYVCSHYNVNLVDKLKSSTTLHVYDFLKLDVELGLEIGEKVKEFMQTHHLEYKVDFVVVHGHTTFHNPAEKITHQLGDIHAIASCLKLPVIHQLRSMDIMLGGQGAPIVPLGEKILFSDNACFLNIGGIANISFHYSDKVIAYDICSANAVLNYFAQKKNMAYDKDGKMASLGQVDNGVLDKLSFLEYYQRKYPKSLSNQWAKDNVIPILEKSGLNIEDILRTYTEHIALMIQKEIVQHKTGKYENTFTSLCITGGGTFNTLLVQNIQRRLEEVQCQVFLPEESIIKYKEAIIMGILGVLRWRLEPNVLCSVTGAKEDSINGILVQPF